MMCVYIAEGDKGSLHYLKKDREPITVLGLSSFLIRQQEQWYLRLPHDLKADRRNPMADGMTVRITKTARKEYAGLYFLQCPDQTGLFHRYCYPHDTFTVGTSIEDDICFDLPWIRTGAFRIDPVNKTISYNQGLLIADLNGTLIRNEIHYRKGDVFCCLYLKIVFHDDFLMINGLFPMKESLLQYRVHHEMNVLPVKQNLQYSHDTVATIEKEISADLKLPQVNDDTYTSQLILSMGPALMMSSASLVSGTMSAYRSYMAGRSAIEIIPSVLLPSVMVLSALLWNPLQKHSEKKQKKKQLQKKIGRFGSECEKLKTQMELQNDLYRTYAESTVMTGGMLQKEYAASHTFLLQDPQKIMIYAGHGKGLFQIDTLPIADTENEEIDTILNKIEEARQELSEVPLLFDLTVYRRIVIEGNMDDLFYLYAANFCYLYEDLDVCMYCSQEYLQKHLYLYEAASIGRDGRRLLFTDENSLERYIREEEPDPERTIVMAMEMQKDIQAENMMVLYFERTKDRHRCGLRIKAEDHRLYIKDLLAHQEYETEYEAAPDETFFDTYVKQQKKTLSGIRNGGFLAMLKETDANRLRIRENQETNDIGDELKCVIGIDEKGEQVFLDLDENGQGPHGLIAGTTGSGKSELLLSMIMSLAVSYSPNRLQFVLIDFKGGTGFQALANEGRVLPHLKAILSDLDADDMKRALFSLKDVLKQREMLFRKLSQLHQMPVRNLKDYRRILQKEDGLEELADIVLIVDEFAELKRERPDFLDELVRIARLGRSLGLHLILATQKPGGIVTDQIWSNTRFKICLKVSEKQDSMEMIHCPDAVYLKDPGTFLLYADEKLTRARCGYLHQKLQKQKKPVSLIDTRGNIVRTAYTCETGQETEFNAALTAICQSDQAPAGKMWLEVLPDLHYQDHLWKTGLLGLKDDYESQMYREIPAMEKEAKARGILSPDPQETVSLLQALLLALNDNEEEKEIYLIDDMHIIEETEKDSSHLVNNAVRTADDELLENLFARMEQDDGVRRILIVSDLTHLFQSDDRYRSMIRKLLQSSATDKSDLWLFVRTSSALNYQEVSLLQDLYCLKNDSINEIQSFLQMPYKSRLHKEGHGIARSSSLLEFAWFQTDRKQFERLNSRNYKAEHRYRLPCMPNDVTVEMYEGEGIPLGILYGSYEWYIASDDLQIVYLFEEETEQFLRYLGEHMNANCISYQDFMKINVVKNDLILTAPAAEEYCRLRHMEHMPKEQEGILIKRGKEEVIHYVRM